jgi:hypothetical protein
MPIMIRDPELELKIDRQRRLRKHKTASKTVRDLLMERFFQIDPPKQAKPSKRIA